MTTEHDEADYYALLEITADASPAAIKAAFKRLALRYHPDVYHGADAEEHMRRLLLAYRTLSNPAERMAYDARRAGGQAPREDWSQSGSDRPAANQPRREAPLRAPRDRTRPYAFPDLDPDAPVQFSLGTISYELSPPEASALQQQGLLRGMAPEAAGMLSPDVLASIPHTCHRCHHRWIPADAGARHVKLWELICPACKANDWGEYLLLRCVHCCAVFESEQIRDSLGPAAGKLFTPYELFPLCPSCGTARWCPAEDARLEALRRVPRGRSKLFGGGA
jgi:hypothetical protein